MGNAISIKKKFNYHSTDDRDLLTLIETTRKGIDFKLFDELTSVSPFSLSDWSQFLHISQRTIQRYKKERRKFDALQSEKILEVLILYEKGVKVFGSSDKFNTWLNTESIALGGAKPVMLLDNTFGIHMLADELSRIEHGILA